MSKRYPKVSVMVITYNQERYIRETLDSVVHQSYPNLEVVIADDCSTDSTPKIIAEYQLRYPEIIKPVFNLKNLGITGNSNAAFFACIGEFIAVMGGDDLFLPEKILRQTEQFEQDPAVVLSYHAVEIFNSDDKKLIFTTNQTPREDLANAYEILTKGGIPGASSVMVRRSACPSGGFDSKLATVSDWLFFTEVALRGRVVKLNGVYGKYRKHCEGASNRTLELLQETLETFEILLAKYPSDNRLAEACRLAKARYLAGEVFRQIVIGNGALAHALCEQILSIQKRPRYVAMAAVAFLIMKFPILSPAISYPLRISKAILKRTLG